MISTHLHFLHANTIWRHSSHGQWDLLHLYVLTLLNSILDIDSCLLLSWLGLHISLALLWSSYMCVSMSPQKLLCYHFYNFCLFHDLLGDIVICFVTLLYHFTHIWTNLLTQCTECQFLCADVFFAGASTQISKAPKIPRKLYKN